MRFVRLKDDFALRGWYGLPFALMNLKNGETGFIDQKSFRALEFCNGRIDADLPLIPPEIRRLIGEAVKLGIAEESKEPRSLSPLQEYRRYDTRYVRAVQWSITGKCNLLCRHCYLCAPEAQYGEPSTEQCLAVVEQLADAGIAQVMITGGEPLVRDDFWVIVDALLEKGIHVNQLYTNGLLVTDAFLAQCRERGLKWDFVLSHDFVGCHDWMRGLDGTEAATEDAMRRIVAAGYPLLIESALHKDNLHAFFATYEKMKEIGVASWKTSVVMDTGNWEKESDKKQIELAVLYDAYLELIKRYKADGAPMSLMLGGFFLNHRGKEEWAIPFDRFPGDETGLRRTMCGSCRTHLYLLPNGVLLPCIPMTGSSLESEMPNVFERSISEIMMDSALFRAVDTRLEDILNKNRECAACEYGLRCGAGCKALALADGGSLYGKDEMACYFWKNGYEKKLHAALDAK